MHQQHTFHLSLALAITLALSGALAAPQAHAQNKGGGSTGSSTGVITIDQARAEAGGITPGDAPGFPLTLSQPGSYRLMGNLSVADIGTNGIVITSPGVTLDFNGFELRGPNTCTGAGTSLNCTSFTLPSNAPRGYGVLVQTPDGTGSSVVVQGGSVRGFAAYGLGGTAGGYRTFVVDRMRVSYSGYVGIGNAGVITNSVVHHNGTHGIASSAAAIRNLLQYNRHYGIALTRVLHNVTEFNGSPDFEVSPLN